MTDKDYFIKEQAADGSQVETIRTSDGRLVSLCVQGHVLTMMEEYAKKHGVSLVRSPTKTMNN